MIERTQAEVIAMLLSNVHPPSLTAMRRAQQIINSLDFHGYKIVKMTHTVHKMAPIEADSGDGEEGEKT